MSNRPSPELSHPILPSSGQNTYSGGLPVVLVPRARPPRLTPRNSIATIDAAEEPKETPYDTLRQLANIRARPTTPLRRASSAGPPIIRSARRTPAAQNRTPIALQRPGSVRRANALTPHARAAIRDLELRRAAALTPGKDRRRSGRQQRETPRDALRQLSKILARNTEPTVPSPDLIERSALIGLSAARNVEFDDGPDLVQPNLSISLDDGDDDSMLLPHRRSSVAVDDDNYTQQSVEMPRRAMSEQARDRLSFGSFGGMIMNERLMDFDQTSLNTLLSEASEPNFLPANFEDDNEPNGIAGIDDFNETSAVALQLMSADSGRTSDIRSRAPVDEDTENTFMLAVSPSDFSSPRVASSQVSMSEEALRDGAISINDVEFDNIQNNILNSDIDVIERSLVEDKAPELKNASRSTKKTKTSRHGIQYPSLPPGVIKKLATTFLQTGGGNTGKISKDTLEAISLASDWFLEQVSDDLGTYANHARRKTIDESDVITLMKRQRQTSVHTTPFALAQRYLPRELLQDVRMPRSTKSRMKMSLPRVNEEDEE